MKEIPLTQGKFAIVDDDDFDTLNQYKWTAHHHHNRVNYAVRSVYYTPKPKMLSMHRVILNATPGTQIDHINGDGLDNRKSNLRFTTTRQNSHNRRPLVPKKSKYPGVFWRKDTHKWRAIISIDGKLRHLGQYESDYEAYVVYAMECSKLGEPVCLS